MTKIYQYFSAGFNCYVTLNYREGILTAAEIEAPTAQADLNHKAYFFTKEEKFLSSCKQNHIKVAELKREITFEMFWDRYAYKVGKHEAQLQWAKLSKVDQEAAFDFIPAYNSRLKLSNEARRHPATYLHKKTWR